MDQPELISTAGGAGHGCAWAGLPAGQELGWQAAAGLTRNSVKGAAEAMSET